MYTKQSFLNGENKSLCRLHEHNCSRFNVTRTWVNSVYILKFPILKLRMRKKINNETWSHTKPIYIQLKYTTINSHRNSLLCCVHLTSEISILNVFWVLKELRDIKKFIYHTHIVVYLNLLPSQIWIMMLNGCRNKYNKKMERPTLKSTITTPTQQRWH